MNEIDNTSSGVLQPFVGSAELQDQPNVASAEPAPERHCHDCREALSAAAHDLKTPIAVLSGYVDLLLSEKLGELTERQREILQEMQSSGARLISYVNDSISFSSVKVGKYTPNFELGDLNACISEVCSFWTTCFQNKDIAFYVLLPEKLKPFPFDYHKTQRILSNLLENAMKYTPEGGTVWLSAEPYVWERRAVSRAWTGGSDRRKQQRNVPNAVRITVSDTGAGIAPEFHQDIFEEYVRLAQPGGRSNGSGLGLAIAKNLVTALQGRIWVESEVAVGSKFFVLIPMNPVVGNTK
jgi:NtrC-family two-component system sensor histidine kinase KinB